MKKLATLTLVAFTLAAPAAFAQFSIPGVGKSTGGGTADLGGQQDSLVRGYAAARKDVLTANAKMADALGLKEAAARAQAKADAMTEGATKGNLVDADKEVADSSAAIAAEMARKPVLDAKSKEKFGSGVFRLTAGVVKFTGLGKDVKAMSTSMSSASPMMLPKLQSAAYVVSDFPSSAAAVTKSLETAVAFAKTNGIVVPTDATKAI